MSYIYMKVKGDGFNSKKKEKEKESQAELLSQFTTPKPHIRYLFLPSLTCIPLFMICRVAQAP